MKKKAIAIVAVILLLIVPAVLVGMPGVQNDSSVGYDDSIDHYIRNLKYNPNQDVVMNTTCSQLPSTYSEEPGKTITVYYRLMTASNNGVEVLANSENLAMTAYPGALLKGNSNLANNTPDMISLERQDIKMSINLPGLSESTFIANPETYGNVADAINAKCDEWAARGDKLPISYNYVSTKAESEKQLEVSLGVTAKQLSGLGINATWTTTSTETKYVVKFTQVFYAVKVTPMKNPSDYFGDSVTLRDIQNSITEHNQAVLVDAVMYGRTVLASVTSKSSGNEIDAAIELAIKGNKQSLTLEQQNIIKNTTTQIFVYGGKAPEETPTDIFEVKDFIKDCIIEGNDIHTAKPIAFSTIFIDNNKRASCTSTTMYNHKYVIETQPILFKYYFHGAFISKYKVTYWTFDKIVFDEKTNKIVYVNERPVTLTAKLLAGNRGAVTIPEKHKPVVVLSVEGVSCKDILTNYSMTPMKEIYYEHWGTTCSQRIKVYQDGQLKLSIP